MRKALLVLNCSLLQRDLQLRDGGRYLFATTCISARLAPHIWRARRHTSEIGWVPKAAARLQTVASRSERAPSTASWPCDERLQARHMALGWIARMRPRVIDPSMRRVTTLLDASNSRGCTARRPLRAGLAPVPARPARDVRGSAQPSSPPLRHLQPRLLPAVLLRYR